MNKKQIKAFTLVELIIVITILAILATIGFMSYQSYTADARDSSRVTSVREISNGLEISFTKNSKYPMPDSPILTGAINGYTYSYKGFVGDSVSKNLKLSDTKDPLSKSYYVYAVDVNQSAFQLATVLENNLASKNNFVNNTYAAGIPTAKVSGNYKGVIKFSSGSSNQETWIANIPSLIWNNTGSVSLLSSSTKYVVDKKSNLPYDLNNGTDIGSKDANSILKEVTGATGATVIGVNITDIINGTKTVDQIFTGSTLDSFNTFGNSTSTISNLEKSIIGNTFSPTSNNVVVSNPVTSYQIDCRDGVASIGTLGDGGSLYSPGAWKWLSSQDVNISSNGGQTSSYTSATSVGIYDYSTLQNNNYIELSLYNGFPAGTYHIYVYGTSYETTNINFRVDNGSITEAGSTSKSWIYLGTHSLSEASKLRFSRSGKGGGQNLVSVQIKKTLGTPSNTPTGKEGNILVP